MVYFHHWPAGTHQPCLSQNCHQSPICHGIYWLHPCLAPTLHFFLNSWPLWGHSLGLNQSQPIYMDHANGGPQGGHLHGSLAMGWVHIQWACTGEVCACACPTSIKVWVHHISYDDTLRRHLPGHQFTQHFRCRVIIACQMTTC